MAHHYTLQADSLAPRPDCIGYLDINMSDEEFEKYVDWYKKQNGNIPDFFDSPLWDHYMEKFCDSVELDDDSSYNDCSVDYPFGFLDDLDAAARLRV